MWNICPLRALGIAACDEARARMIGKHVLDLIEARAPNHDDPFVQSIASCLTDLQAFVAGQSMSQQLETIVAPAGFHNVNESSIEGLHASTNRSLNAARNYGTGPSPHQHETQHLKHLPILAGRQIGQTND